ncbi:MAG: hypothetical protein AAGH41_07275 [Pseudomonadota bacterium]
MNVLNPGMEEKRQDLAVEKQKKLLERLLSEVSSDHLDLYYRPTTEIAHILHQHIRGDAKLTVDERSLIEHLSQRDIQLRLSLH